MRLSEKRKAAVETTMKKAIYEAAVNTLLEHGLEGLTMDRVAEAAEMAKGTLYNYFKDKHRLQLYVFVKVSESFHQQIFATYQSNIPCMEKLITIIEQLFHGFEKHRQIIVILAQGRLQNLKEYSAQLAQIPEFANTEAVKYPIEKIIELIIQEGVQLKEFQPFDPTLATDIVLGSITSMIDRHVRENHPRVDEKTITQFIQFIKDGLILTLPSSTHTHTRRPNK